MCSLKASTHEANHPPFHFHTHGLHNAHVHTQTIAIIQPDKHSHFHEKGECEESEHSGPSICCTMWLPNRVREITGLMERARRDTLINCFSIFVYSTEGFFPLNFSVLFLAVLYHRVMCATSKYNHRHVLSTKAALNTPLRLRRRGHQQQQVIED